MIKMIGIDHTKASLDVRSLFAVRKSDMANLCAEIKDQTGADGVVLINTCNRMELWIDTDETKTDLLGTLCERKGLAASQYEEHFQKREGEEAIAHLMWLTCGLKSAILAEDQILTQVKQALDFARAERLSNSTLDVLFRTAITAAKKIKTEVQFVRSDKTAIDQAIRSLEMSGISVAGQKCLVIGNGEYGRLAAESLRNAGAHVTVTIRQYHSGEVQIPSGCRTIQYGDKYQYFPETDIVVSATASPNYTLFYDKVKECKVDHPMVLIDLAVPRDIDPKIRELDGYTLYDIDDFATGYNPENDEAMKKVRAIIEEKMEEFRCWHDYRDVIPLIEKIKVNASDDICGRISKPLAKNVSGEKEREELNERVADASRKVVANLFYKMRDALDEETFKTCVKALWEETSGT